jgi:hypothetical protein
MAQEDKNRFIRFFRVNGGADRGYAAGPAILAQTALPGRMPRQVMA